MLKGFECCVLIIFIMKSDSLVFPRARRRRIESMRCDELLGCMQRSEGLEELEVEGR